MIWQCVIVCDVVFSFNLKNVLGLTETSECVYQLSVSFGIRGVINAQEFLATKPTL